MKMTFSTRQKFWLSVSLGCSAAVGGWVYLRQAEQRIRSQYTMTTVLQARKYIKEGKTIESGWVDEVPIPVRYLPPMAIQTKKELVNDKSEFVFKARTSFLKGDFISRSRLVDGSSGKTLAWALTDGQTALTLKLRSEQSVAGLLRPGDSVNIYGTLDQQPGIASDQTQLLLSRVSVLAVDDRLWDDSPASMNDNAEISRESHLVTLALSPGDAGLVTLAADKGRIVLALTSPLDTQIHKMRALKLADMR